MATALEQTPQPAQEEAVVLPVALREMTLSAEAAERLRELLDEASQPAQAGKEMPTADASVLLKKVR